MTFAWPLVLWLLVLPAALLAWELVRARRAGAADHPKILRAQAGLRSVSLQAEEDAPSTLARRRILLCAGLAFGIVALARPQWGRLDEPVFDQSRDIIIALDLSRSMLTPDVKPSRLERSKLLIESLLDRLHGERVGMIVFSGTAFLQSPVSADYEILKEFLPTLDPDYLPEGGTNYHQLIDTALEAFGTGAAADRYLIVLSDGEATDEDWKERIPELTKRGIRVIGLGVGTAAGGMIPDGSGNFMKDEKGAVVLSKLEDGSLRELARATHGTYVDASEWVDISKVLAQTVETGKKGRFLEHNTVRLAERYQWALAQGLACLIASFWLEFPVRPKSRAVRLSPPSAGRAAAAAALLALLALFAAPARADAPADGNPAAALSKIVGRLSAQEQCSALDWSEFGHETVTWGEHVKSAGQPVPERPVRDALSAVEVGSSQDPKATDWPKLRKELEDLLEKPAPKKNPDQKQDKDQDKDKDKDQDKRQDKDQGKGQDSKQGAQQPSKPQGGQDKDSSQDGSPPSKPQDSKDSAGQPSQKDREQKPQDQAFGDMSKAPTPPPVDRQHPMQQVGGAKKDPSNDPASRMPELAVPLEKLEQVKNQDSPAQLFDMIRKSEPNAPAPSTGKNW